MRLIANRRRFNLCESALAPALAVENDDRSCLRSEHATERIRTVAASECDLSIRIGIDECVEAIF